MISASVTITLKTATGLPPVGSAPPVNLAWHFDLTGGRHIAGDISKFRAQDSKKNNFNQKKIDRPLKMFKFDRSSTNP